MSAAAGVGGGLQREAPGGADYQALTRAIVAGFEARDAGALALAARLADGYERDALRLGQDQGAEARARAGELRALIRANAKKRLKAGLEGPTLMGRVKARAVQGPVIARMLAAGDLTDQQAHAAQEVVNVFGWVSSRLVAKAMDYSKGGAGDAAREAYDNAMADRHAGRYLPWVHDARVAPVLPLIFAVLVDEMAWRDIHRVFRTDHRTAKARIAAALALYGRRG